MLRSYSRDVTFAFVSRISVSFPVSESKVYLIPLFAVIALLSNFENSPNHCGGTDSPGPRGRYTMVTPLPNWSETNPSLWSVAVICHVWLHPSESDPLSHSRE